MIELIGHNPVLAYLDMLGVLDEDDTEDYVPEVGDVVMLASGGPYMTVVDISDDGSNVSCNWFNDVYHVVKGSFPSESLILLEDTDD